MTSLKTLATLGFAFSLCGTGCVLDESAIGSDVQSLCPYQDCGNSAMSNGYPASELNLDGLQSVQDFHIVSYHDADTNQPLIVDAHDSEFYIFNGSLGWLPLGQGPVQSMEIELERDNGDPAIPEIHKVRVEMPTTPLLSWVEANTAVPSYYMSYWDWSDPSGPWKPFCSKFKRGVEVMTHAALIVGERYDLDTKEVLPPAAGDDRWFNVACEAGALLKNKLLGYDPEFAINNISTTPAERQATLRMMTATYCGSANPTSYTTNGTPLNWQNEYNWFDAPQGELEAAWGPDGAICLDNPRHPELWDNACAIPACNGVIPPKAMWWTTNPPAP